MRSGPSGKRQSHRSRLLQRARSSVPRRPSSRRGRPRSWRTMMSVTARSHAHAGSGGWLAPLGLLLLGMLPVIAGAFRLEQLAGISDAMPANARFSPMPLPVVLHIVSATAFATLGPLQFAAGFRRRWPAWHRVAGRLLVSCGLLVGLTGLWMTLFYACPDGSGPLLYASRIVIGSAMVVCLVIGLAVILRRDVQGHRRWMSRG